jgi:nicotinamidase-related amidase
MPNIAVGQENKADLELRRRKITGIVLAGISTSIGVESAARAANERGYDLTIVTDAVTDTSEGAHFYSLEVISPRIAELATTNEVLAAIENGHRPEGRNTKIGATGK